MGSSWPQVVGRACRRGLRGGTTTRKTSAAAPCCCSCGCWGCSSACCADAGAADDDDEDEAFGAGVWSFLVFVNDPAGMSNSVFHMRPARNDEILQLSNLLVGERRTKLGDSAPDDAPGGQAQSLRRRFWCRPRCSLRHRLRRSLRLRVAHRRWWWWRRTHRSPLVPPQIRCISPWLVAKNEFCFAPQEVARGCHFSHNYQLP